MSAPTSFPVLYPCDSEGCGHSIYDHANGWLCTKCYCPFWCDPEPRPIGDDYGGMST